MGEQIEFVDRYGAMGIPSPNAWTGCKGGCEGVGIHPQRFEQWEGTPEAKRPRLCPQRDENGAWSPFPPEDGWAWVYCAGCGGTGRKIGGGLGRVLDYVHTYYYALWWPLWAARNELETGFATTGNGSRLRTALADLPHNVRFIWREQKAQRSLLKRHR